MQIFPNIKYCKVAAYTNIIFTWLNLFNVWKIEKVEYWQKVL